MVDVDTRAELIDKLTNPGADRIWYVADAFRAGFALEEMARLLGYRSLVLGAAADLVEHEAKLKDAGLQSLEHAEL